MSELHEFINEFERQTREHTSPTDIVRRHFSGSCSYLFHDVCSPFVCSAFALGVLGMLCLAPTSTRNAYALCVCVCVAGRWRHVSRWIRWQLWHWRTSNRLIQRFWRVVDDAVDCYSSFWQNKFERSENSQRLFQPKIIIMNENKTHRWICTTQTLRSPMASAQTIGTRMKSREPVWSHTIPFLITLFTEFQSIMILLRVFGDDWCHCSRIEAQNASRWQNENRKLWFNVCVDVSMGWSGAFFRSSRDSKHATSLSSSSLSPSLCLGGRHVIQ